MDSTKGPDMPTNLGQRAALDAYMAHHTAALALIERIHEAIENHDSASAPDDLHWGHVGDMAATRAALRAIADRLFGEGEYAPATA